MIFRTKKRRSAEHGEAAGSGKNLGREDQDGRRGDSPGSTAELIAEMKREMAENQRTPDRERERRILRLRHQAGIRYLAEAGDRPDYATPEPARLPEERLGPIQIDSLTPGLIRAGILRDGAVFVRGAVARDAAEHLAAGIEQVFRDREAAKGGSSADSLYEEFVPEPGFSQLSERNWIELGGGVLAADSPRLIFEMFNAFERSRLTDMIAGYLGERVAVSAEKCTLRKADPAIAGAWHQDGNFMGDVRSLNVWLSLSRCGDEAPGLDLVPKRIDHLVEAGTEGAALSYVITQEKINEAAGGVGIVRPIFEPGDILLFDDLFLHQTASDPSMPNPRYAVESWFFGASGFPEDYAPIAA